MTMTGPTAVGEAIAAGMDNPPRVLIAYDTLPDGDPASLPPPPSAVGDPIRWLYFTSGTTSDPKGARHTDGTLLAGGRGLAAAVGIAPPDVGSIAFHQSIGMQLQGSPDKNNVKVVENYRGPGEHRVVFEMEI